ncbi:MAG: hypothetical protein J6125_02355, partial [Clostridia bacterium]|nr:hypothetical protein [Clostridia bacterium]
GEKYVLTVRCRTKNSSVSPGNKKVYTIYYHFSIKQAIDKRQIRPIIQNSAARICAQYTKKPQTVFVSAKAIFFASAPPQPPLLPHGALKTARKYAILREHDRQKRADRPARGGREEA